MDLVCGSSVDIAKSVRRMLLSRPRHFRGAEVAGAERIGADCSLSCDYIAENKGTNSTNLTYAGGQKGDKLSPFYKNM